MSAGSPPLACAGPRAAARGRAWRTWRNAGLAMLGAWLLLAAWTPPEDAAWSVCLFRRVTHVECPTCGMTRALSLLAHGRPAASLAKHPLAAPLAAEAALLWLLAPLALVRGWRPPRAWLRAWAVAHGAALLIVWGARLVA
ncbi:MAG: DUF2752 domain-containing protein [Candidatus Eisenbacteria bacterium]|nr:DUF2752 domain-containing protein [Candidatus Eisenbacteria bacterium]